MRSGLVRVRWRILPGLVLLIALAPGSALAAELRQGDAIAIAAGETIDDDLYAVGEDVRVDGTINGDLVAAGGTIALNGPVSGDVIALGGTLTLAGPVRGSVRIAGGQVTIQGPVERDGLMAGGTVEVPTAGRIGRDLLLGGGTTTVTGAVGRNVLASAGDMTFSGPIGGNLQTALGRLTLASGALVGGDLSYTSDEPATIAPGATVRGRVEQRAPERQAQRAASPVGLAIGWLRGLIGMFVLAAGFVLLFPLFSRSAEGALAASPARSFGIGLLVMLAGPLLAMLVFAIGLIVGGWWIGLFLLALYGLALALGYVVCGLFVGDWLTTRQGRAGLQPIAAALVGLAILLLVGLVPVVGWLISLLATVVGLGGLARAFARSHATAEAAAA